MISGNAATLLIKKSLSGDTDYGGPAWRKHATTGTNSAGWGALQRVSESRYQCPEGLFVSGSASVEVGDSAIFLTEFTEYPELGQVDLGFDYSGKVSMHYELQGSVARSTKVAATGSNNAGWGSLTTVSASVYEVPEGSFVYGSASVTHGDSGIEITGFTQSPGDGRITLPFDATERVVVSYEHETVEPKVKTATTGSNNAGWGSLTELTARIFEVPEMAFVSGSSRVKYGTSAASLTDYTQTPIGGTVTLTFDATERVTVQYETA